MSAKVHKEHSKTGKRPKTKKECSYYCKYDDTCRCIIFDHFKCVGLRECDMWNRRAKRGKT